MNIIRLFCILLQALSFSTVFSNNCEFITLKHSGEKIYFHEVFVLKTPETDLRNFPVPQYERNVDFSISGPTQLSKGEHELFIEFHSINPDNVKYYLYNFDLGIKAESNSISCRSPEIEYKIQGDDEWKPLVDKSKQSVIFYTSAKIAFITLKLLLKPIAIITGGSELLGDFIEWLNIDENNWLKIWRETFLYDYYPLTTPVRTNYAGAYKIESVRIKVPLSIYSNEGEIAVLVNFMNVRNLSSNSSTTDYAFITDKQYIVRKSIPAEHLIRVNATEIQSNSIDLWDNSGGNSYLEMEYEILRKNGSQYLSINVFPDAIPSNTEIFVDRINIQLNAERKTVQIPELPVYISSDGTVIPYETMKKSAGEELLFNGLFYLTESIIGTKEMDLISSMKEGGETGKTILDEKMQIPYEEALQNQWKVENTFDNYILPSFKPKITFEADSKRDQPIKILIPIEFYKKDPWVRIYINCEGRQIYTNPNALTTGSLNASEVKYWRMVDLDYSKKKETKKQAACNIGFILDSSGSMESNDPANVRKSAVKLIIDRLKGNENFFLVDFDHSSNWLTNQTWQNWTAADLKNTIDQIDSDGGTNVGLGLSTMHNTLESSLNSFDKTAVVLLTDGQGSYHNEIDWFVQNNIKVYTVSYKDAADAALLESIATATGGVYLRANDENEVVAAFMQFYDDLQGNSKYLSYSGSFRNQSTIQLPAFYIDKGSSELTCNVNWTGMPLKIVLNSPTGDIFTSELINVDEDGSLSENLTMLQGTRPMHGPHAPLYTASEILLTEVQWTKGEKYLIARINNPQPGKWGVQLKTANGQVSNEEFLFEAGGSSPAEINLQHQKNNSGYLYSLTENSGEISWAGSNATIILETPEKKSINISSNYRNGSFSFYPMAGKGIYNIKVLILGKDKAGNLFQRSFIRSEYVGEVLPGNIAPIKETMGMYVISDQGSFTGNLPGTACYIYAPGGSKNNPKAKGTVTSVMKLNCTIRITMNYSNERVKPGDIIELDMAQWQNDQ